ncbi:RNA polymerase sigma factor [Lacrimispora xylanisolvens]|uniref:RNA polymerase sigma factor n=1 Tax=Lacrimispora xylanisolvens TaxID=384636 RepID=UPI0024026BCF
MVCSYGLKNRLWRFAMFLLLSVSGQREEKQAVDLNTQGHSVRIGVQACRLMKEYGNSVLRLAYSYLHNMSDAEDVLQDTLIQFLKTQPHFESGEHEKAWILRVASNISKNRITYNKIRKTDELTETLAAEETQDLTFVWEAVKQLPPKYSEVIHLFYHEGYSTAEIASILSKNEATVRSLLMRARMKLKDVLKEVYDFGEPV